MTDSLIIGFNDSPFEEYLGLVKSMGEDSGAYRDLNLAYADHEGRPYRSMDLLNRFYSEGREGLHRPFNNTDFLWPTILYLGSYLHRRGFSFDFVNQFQMEKEALREKLERGDVLSVAITTTLYVTAHPILEIISFVRQCNDKVKIIVGGPYVSNQSQMLDAEELQKLFRFINADFYVISQEGELAFANLLAALKSGTGLDGIDNIAYRERDRFVITKSSVERNPLEENRVDYGLFDPRSIGEFVSLRSAKSCPFTCAFCGFPQRAGQYTYLDVGLVEEELSTLAEIGSVSTLTFLDDTFNVPKPRFKELMRMMIRNGYGFRWNSFYRSDHGDEETIELMARAGCEGVFLGVESGSDEMLKRMNKSSRRHNYMKAIPLFRQAGISTYASFIIGFPGETYETMQETVSLVNEARPEYFRAQLWYCDPMTPIWNRRQEFGVQGSAFSWSHQTMDYRTACDLIDEIFLSAEGSIWLPQTGFEQWSTFYLQRKGMSVEQIHRFLRCFNAAVRQQLLQPARDGIDPDLLAALRASCQFDRVAELDQAPIRLEPGAYRDAEEHWTRELRQAEEPGLRRVLERPGRSGPMGCLRFFQIGPDVVSALERQLGAEIQKIVLAVYGLILSRAMGREAVWLICFLEESGESATLPLRLPAPWDASFRQLVQQVSRQAAAAREHWTYAFHFLSRSPSPVFEAAYAFGEAAQVLPASVAAQIGLRLRVLASQDGLHLELESLQAWCTPEVLEEVGSFLAEALARSSREPEIPLGRLVPGGEPGGPSDVVKSDSEDLFNF